MATDVRSTLFDHRTMTLPLSRTQRLEMEQAIEAAIALLDRADGDPDLEEEPDAFGELCNYHPVRPQYAVDQTRGPTNRAAIRASGAVQRPFRASDA